MPDNRLLPLFDTSWKMPPPLRPIEASYRLVWSFTSSSVSGAGAMLRDSVPPPASMVPREPLVRLLQQSMLVTSMPLNRKLLFVVRAPFTLGEIDALSFDSSSLMSADTPGSIASS